MSDPCVQDCPATCPQVFERVRVFPIITGGTRIEWSLLPNFIDPQPQTFQIQVGRTANQAADDWTNVGLPAVNASFGIDAEQRVYGMTQWTHYRIVCTTPIGVYISDPTPALGNLSLHDWRIVNDLFRQNRLRLERTHAGVQGYLLKRRLYGAKCTVCSIDIQTGECRYPQCPSCFGTGFQGGYFAPIPCVYVDLQLRMTRDKLDGQMRGTVNDVTLPNNMMLASPYVNDSDIWIDRYADVRYALHEVQYAATVRGVPVLLSCNLRPIPFSSPIYTIPVSGQVPV